MKATLVVLFAVAAARAADAPSAKPQDKKPQMEITVTEAAKEPEVHTKDTPKERKRVHAHFAAIDVNGDHVIDAKEIEAFAHKMHDLAAKKKVAKPLSYEDILALEKAELSKADEKHDGKITEEEYDRLEEPLEAK